MKLQRYKSSGHYSDGPCDHGEWVKADEHEAEVARLNQICADKFSEIYKLSGEVLRLRKALEFIEEQAMLLDLHGIKRQCREALFPKELEGR